MSAGGAVAVRRTTLAPELSSPGRARRLLREVLVEGEREGWLDAAELAVSEVVTNAALHAHTTIDLVIELFADQVLVEVRDGNPQLPLPVDYEDEATTGRGLGLVAAITTACGVRSLGDDGKVTWFSVGDAPDRSPEELLGAWDVDEDATTAPVAGAVTVVLAPMPATLWLAARQHHDAILRELVLYLAERDDVEVDLATADRARGHVSAALAQALAAAQAAGRAHPVVPPGHPSPLPWVPDDLALRVSLRPDAGADFAALQAVLDVAEDLAVAGRLLVRPALPEIIAARDWVCQEVVHQLAGEAPRPWAGTAQERFETAVHDRIDPGRAPWDAREVSGAERGVVAADDANRIVAVSRPLAEALGWDADDLVGRRVVTLVPHALREAHVAGFTRHLSTGEAHLIGVPLQLPVLRADGTEVVCDFLVERAAASGRAVYLAWIEPVDRAVEPGGVREAPGGG